MTHSYEELVERAKLIRPLRRLEGHTGWIDSVAFSPNGNFLASASADSTLRIWEVATGSLVNVFTGHDERVSAVAFSPNGKWLVSGSGDKTVRVWSMESNQELRTLQGHSGHVFWVVFSPNGSIIASASGYGDNTVRLWNADTEHIFHIMKGHTKHVNSVDFSSDGSWLVSASDDQTVRLWEVETGREMWVGQKHSQKVLHAIFSPDGHHIASVSADGIIRLWNAQSGQEKSVLSGHNSEVNAVIWGPDGTILCSCSKNAKDAIRFWHIESGRTFYILIRTEAIYDTQRALAISPDGRILATYPPDSLNAIQLYDISALDVGPKPASAPEPVYTLTSDIATPLHTQLRTLPLAHVSVPDFPEAQAASWLRGAAAAGWPLPLALARDLGLLLTRPANQLTLAKPAHLPFDEDTASYLAFLERVAAHPLVRSLPSWRPPLSDAVLAVVLARLVEGLELPDAYRSPAGADGVVFVRELGRLLAGSDLHRHNGIRAPVEAPAASTAPVVRLDQLSIGQGAQFGEWQVWRDNGGLFLIHPATGSVLGLREGSNGWVNYRDPNGQEGTIFAGGEYNTTFAILGDYQRYLRGLPTARLTPHTATFGSFHLHIAATQLDLTHEASAEQYSVWADRPRFQMRINDEEELWFPPDERAAMAAAHLPAATRAATVAPPTVSARGHTDPAQLWRATPAAARPSWRTLLPASALAQIERNLRAFDPDELRFLSRYGAPLLGSPDPRSLLDLLALTQLPEAARLALSQTLKLLPRLSDSHTVGGVQTYPEGGYEGLARTGSLDSLLPSEAGFPEDVFAHRVLNHEALYYGRERPRERRKELAYIIGQLGWGLGGDGQVLVRALLLALHQAMRARGYEVRYSLAGAQLSEPRSLDTPGEVGRVLYAQEPGVADGGVVLRGVLAQLKGWRDVYRGRQVLWVLSEHFDADGQEAHAALYQALRAEAGQQAWYVRVGAAAERTTGQPAPPASARALERWVVIDSARLWAARERG